ncbi:MAG: hypothetical protein ABI564_17140, partial [Ideonella sp.]
MHPLEQAEDVVRSNADVVKSIVFTLTLGSHSVSVKRSEWVTEPQIVDRYRFARGGARVPES